LKGGGGGSVILRIRKEKKFSNRIGGGKEAQRNSTHAQKEKGAENNNFPSLLRKSPNHTGRKKKKCETWRRGGQPYYLSNLKGETKKITKVSRKKAPAKVKPTRIPSTEKKKGTIHSGEKTPAMLGRTRWNMETSTSDISIYSSSTLPRRENGKFVTNLK